MPVRQTAPSQSGLDLSRNDDAWEPDTREHVGDLPAAINCGAPELAVGRAIRLPPLIEHRFGAGVTGKLGIDGDQNAKQDVAEAHHTPETQPHRGASDDGIVLRYLSQPEGTGGGDQDKAIVCVFSL